MTCSVIDCTRLVVDWGSLCRAHRHRLRRYGDPAGRNVMFGASQRERLERGLRPDRTPDECWIWQRARNAGGYGIVSTPDGRTRLAHRAAYEEYVGPVPEGLALDHLCLTKPCCNPRHLEPVTRGENNRRAAVSRRQAAYA